MNIRETRKTAILVDGGYYRKRAIALWGKNKTAAERADELFRYCLLHISEPDEIISEKKLISDLTKDDFKLDVKQKGVDMRIGLDVASLSYGKYVNQIVLIAGDSDFIPVAKMARKSGIDFILDPMKQHIKPKLSEHIDGIETYTDKMYIVNEEKLEYEMETNDQ